MKRLVIVLFMVCCVGFSRIGAKSSCNNEIEKVEQNPSLEGVWVLENANLEEVKPDNNIIVNSSYTFDNDSVYVSKIRLHIHSNMVSIPQIWC